MNHSSTPHHALKLQRPAAEVDQQAGVQLVGFEIVDRLGEVHVLQLDDGLDFDHDLLFDEEVDAAGADFSPFVVDLHRLLAHEIEPLYAHFLRQRALVDDLLKAVAQDAVHFHGTADDLAGQGGLGIFGVYVCVLWWLLVHNCLEL